MAGEYKEVDGMGWTPNRPVALVRKAQLALFLIVSGAQTGTHAQDAPVPAPAVTLVPVATGTSDTAGAGAGAFWAWVPVCAPVTIKNRASCALCTSATGRFGVQPMPSTSLYSRAMLYVLQQRGTAPIRRTSCKQQLPVKRLEPPNYLNEINSL